DVPLEDGIDVSVPVGAPPDPFGLLHGRPTGLLGRRGVPVPPTERYFVVLESVGVEPVPYLRYGGTGGRAGRIHQGLNLGDGGTLLALVPVVPPKRHRPPRQDAQRHGAPDQPVTASNSGWADCRRLGTLYLVGFRHRRPLPLPCPPDRRRWSRDGR